MNQEILSMGILSWAIITCYVLYDNYKLTLKIDNLSYENSRLIQSLDYNNEDHQKTYNEMTRWCEDLRQEVFSLQRELQEAKSARNIN